MERPSAHGRERRMEHNRNNRLLRLKMCLWNAMAPTGRQPSWWILDEDNADLLADRELRRLYAAMSKLTERQSESFSFTFIKV